MSISQEWGMEAKKSIKLRLGLAFARRDLDIAYRETAWETQTFKTGSLTFSVSSTEAALSGRLLRARETP